MLLNAVMPETDKKRPPKKPANMSKQAANEEINFNELLADIGRTQNKDSFIILFNHFAPRIKSFLIKAGLNSESADELAQETMLTIWHKSGNYDPKQSAASTWIFTIARNKRIDLLRKIGRNHITSFDDTHEATIQDEAPSPHEITANTEEQNKLSAAIKKLPEDQLSLIKKSFFEFKSHATISQETGIPLGTVKSRIRLALEKLRQQSGVKELWN